MPRSLTALLFVLIAACAAAGAFLYFVVMPHGSFSEPRDVEIPHGASPDAAGAILEEQGVISSAAFFSFYCERHGITVQKGTYRFNSPVYPWYAARVLARGVHEEVDIAVTIPEGKRLSEIAAILDRHGVTNGAELLRRARDRTFILDVTGGELDSLEGFLFPDTYKFKPGTPADDVIRRLYKRLIEVIGGRTHPSFSLKEWITLASIVEREAQVESERARIAAVFMNRLKRGMPLEADPTVRFALDKWDTEPVLYVDLEVNSPYNTYRVRGLPPGPIASVGRASLEAVLAPLETNELFFVATGDGSHAFAATYQEHLANVRRYRR